MSSPKTAKKRSLNSMRLSSIVALVITLNILGAIALIRIITIGLDQSFKEQIAFNVELPENYKLESYQELEPELRQIVGIQSVTYISADSALQYIKRKHGEDPVKLLGHNPLPSMLQIHIQPKYMQSDSLKKIQDAISLLGLDSDGFVGEQEEQLGLFNRNMRIGEWVLLFLLIVQGVFTFVQIGNTTRMTIYAQRLQIRTLTLVGASSWFIRRPIVWRSLIDGLVASLISILCLAISLSIIEASTIDFSLLKLLLNNKTALAIAIGALIAFALLGSGVASYLSTQRYIKMDGKRIHII